MRQLASYVLLCVSALAFMLVSCQGSIGERLSGTPFAFGKAGKLAVLADPEVWDGNPGDTLRFYYEAAFPILPQPEPLFDLQPHTPDDLIQDPIKKQLRSFLILANMSASESPTTKIVKDDMSTIDLEGGYGDNDYQFKVGQNKWAQNQLVLYIIARNESGLIDGIKAGLPTFSKRLYEFDKIQYEANLFLGGHNVGIENKLKAYYGIDMAIPDRYAIGIDEQPFLWLQDVSVQVTSGLLFYKMPYTDKSLFSEEQLIVLRDSLTKRNISSNTPKSYMMINNIDLPTFYYSREIDGKYAAELRGIWEMKNEFMGGAFASFLIHHPARDEVFFVDGFVYGPGHDKREPMKQLIYLIENIKLLQQ